MALLLKVARGYTEKQIGLNSTKLLKKMDIGGSVLNIKHQAQVINISTAPFVKLQTNNKKSKTRNIGVKQTGSDIIKLPRHYTRVVAMATPFFIV